MPDLDSMSLAEMRRKLALRLGYGSQGQALVSLKELLNEFLQDAQEQLYEQFSDVLLQDFELNKQLFEGQTMYDLGQFVDPKRLDQVSVKISGDWVPLRLGIVMFHRNDDTGCPSRYEIEYGTGGGTQIEINPIPDKNYTLGYAYTRKLGRFTQGEDLCTIHSRMVLTLALSNAAQHYQRPNAERLAAQANGMLGQMRARKNRGVVVRRGTPTDPVRAGMVNLNRVRFDQNITPSDLAEYYSA